MFGLGMNSIMQPPVPSNGYGLANQGMNTLLGQQYNQANQSNMQQQMQAWNSIMTRTPVQWMFNGKVCDVRTMADEIWHEDCPEKTHFILKYE